MVSLINLVKAVIGTALLSKSVREAIRIAFAKTMNLIMQPSKNSTVNAFINNIINSKSNRNRTSPHQTLLEGALAFLLLRFAKKSWITEPAVISAIGAILITLIRSLAGHRSSNKRDEKDNVIDIDEFTVVDENA